MNIEEILLSMSAFSLCRLFFGADGLSLSLSLTHSLTLSLSLSQFVFYNLKSKAPTLRRNQFYAVRPLGLVYHSASEIFN